MDYTHCAAMPVRGRCGRCDLNFKNDLNVCPVSCAPGKLSERALLITNLALNLGP